MSDINDAATLETIGAALLAKLQTLLNTATPAGPFALAGWFAGSPTQEALAQACTAQPAALLAFESEEPVPGTTVATTSGGLMEQDMRAIFRIYLVLNDAREDAQAESGATGMPVLIKAVKAAFSGLVIADLSDLRDTVYYAGTKEARTERGVLYANVMRFTADYPSDVADSTVTGTPFERFDADIDLVDTDGDPQNPLAQIRVDF